MAVNAVSTVGSSPITQAQFLQLLAAQMKNQDPGNPISDTQFATQLAQFSTLQGVQQLNTNFSDMLALQQLTGGANLVGRTVIYNRTDGSGLAQGTVSAVAVQNGKLQMNIGGVAVPLSNVVGIQQPKGS